jgi:hypothetical protein
MGVSDSMSLLNDVVILFIFLQNSLNKVIF